MVYLWLCCLLTHTWLPSYVEFILCVFCVYRVDAFGNCDIVRMCFVLWIRPVHPIRSLGCFPSPSVSKYAVSAERPLDCPKPYVWWNFQKSTSMIWTNYELVNQGQWESIAHECKKVFAEICEGAHRHAIITKRTVWVSSWSTDEAILHTNGTPFYPMLYHPIWLGR